jgi:hypothetical protein
MRMLRGRAVEALERSYAEHAPPAADRARPLPVIGVVGNTVPVEFILAAGAWPLQIAPTLPRLTPFADPLIERTEPWPMRSMADQVLSGDFSHLALLVISRAEEWLYYNLKEAVRIGAGETVPPLHLHDLILNEAASVAAYNKAQTAMLLERLRRTDGGVTRDQITAAVALVNGRRELMRRLEARRSEGAFGGIQAMRLLGAAHFMHPQTYCDLLEQALAEIPAASVPASRPRLVVITSEPLFHTELHRAIEDTGAVVVGEDSWWGSRSTGPDIVTHGDIATNVHDWYVHHSQSEDMQPREARERWVCERVGRGDIDGAIFYLPPADKRFGWDYPGLKTKMQKSGVASCLIRQDVLTEGGLAQARGSLSAFIDGLTGERPESQRVGAVS